MSGKAKEIIAGITFIRIITKGKSNRACKMVARGENKTIINGLSREN